MMYTIVNWIMINKYLHVTIELYAVVLFIHDNIQELHNDHE